MKISDDDNVLPFRAPARNKRVWASVEREAELVIEKAFLEALQRDPKQQREWVVLIYGLPHQIKLIKKVMKRLKVRATIVMDFIHVLEYLWKAAWCFFDKGDDAVEEWIAERLMSFVEGKELHPLSIESNPIGCWNFDQKKPASVGGLLCVKVEMSNRRSMQGVTVCITPCMMRLW